MATTDYLSPLGSEDPEELPPALHDSSPGEEDEGKAMSLIDHLEELRSRLIVSLISIAAAAIVGWFLEPWLFRLMIRPLSTAVQTPLYVTSIGGAFSIHLQLTFAIAVVLALPVLLYEIYSFIAPGLTKNEKRYSVPFILIGVVLFICGVVTAYFVLRYPIAWLIGFTDKEDLRLLPKADEYFTFVGFFLLVFGLVFELPLVLTFLAQINIVSSAFLREKRAVALFGLWIASMFITPGADWISPIIMGVAFTILYEISILLCRLTKH